MAAESIRAARLGGLDPRRELADALPPPVYILSLLALDADVEEFRDSAEMDNPAGGHYRLAAELAPQLRPLRPHFEALFQAAYGELRSPRLPARGEAGSLPAKPYVTAPGELWLPTVRRLKGSHPYALDVFFYNVERIDGVEIGPPILSLGEGIVVAAAGDWRGGAGASSWISGGLSPAAGNGVVVYEPGARRYCSYFHLSAISVRPGEIVHAGTTLGIGGNSGANARRKDHGEHLHMEIFDVARDAALSGREILAILKD